MAITLTTSAANRVQQYMKSDGGAALRLGVRKTGCSGWAYTVDITDEINQEDCAFDDQGVRIVVAADSLSFIDGSKVDFVADGLNHTFQFDNPNVTDECGCGESFTIKDVA
jgi:iron-sulfur cluster assembly protein